METQLTASVATFRVFSSSPTPASRHGYTQMDPPDVKDRMAATPVTEGPLLLSKLASNEVTYLQVNDFTRAIMARSRIWRVSRRELVIPASFNTYWLVSLRGSSAAVGRLERTLRGLCRYEICCAAPPSGSSSSDGEDDEGASSDEEAAYGNYDGAYGDEYDDSIELGSAAANGIGNANGNNLNGIAPASPYRSERVRDARQIISRGKMSQMLSNVSEKQTPWSAESAAAAVRASPLSSPESVRSERGSEHASEHASGASGSGPPSPQQQQRASDSDVALLRLGTPFSVRPAKQSSPSAQTQTPTEALIISTTQTEATTDTTAEAIVTTQTEATTTETTQTTADTEATTQAEPVPTVQTEQSSTAQTVPTVIHTEAQTDPVPTMQSAPSATEAGNDAAGFPRIEDKFAPRFSHPLIPAAHISRYYPKPALLRARPAASLPKRDLTQIGPSTLHQEVTTVGGYIGLRAVRGLLRKT